MILLYEKVLTFAMLLSVVQGEGFEPPKAEPDDLQSPVFDRFTNPALVGIIPEFFEPVVFSLRRIHPKIHANPCSGADRGIRTHDPLFTKQPL